MTDEFLIKCFKWRLLQNDCLNRGYILDGFPRSYKNARHLFMGKFPSRNSECLTLSDIKEDAEDEEEPDDDEEEPEPPRVINNILKPDTVILIEAPKSYMMNFIDNMTQSEV